MSTAGCRIVLAFALALILVASLASSRPASRAEGGPAGDGGRFVTVPCQPDGGTLQLDCPAFPNTSPTKQPQWDTFAWNSFIAANWPALDPEKNNEQRGFPDLQQSFVNAESDSLLVWETFKEKREVFFYPPDPNHPPPDPGPWNQAPHYGPLVNPPPLCKDLNVKGSEAQRFFGLGSAGKDAPNPRRFFGQGSKGVFNTEDETVEVLSEALETPVELCGGFTTNPCSAKGSGTPDCSCVHGLPVAPHLWKGAGFAQPVVYEVKVNYDFYQYVVDNSYYVDTVKNAARKASSLQLPFRTSWPSQTGGGIPRGVFGYDSQACLANYKQAKNNTYLTPCPIGSVQIKTAWIPLRKGVDDFSKYHTTEAAYFKTEKDGETKCMSYATFGLVGIHIIQRIHARTGDSPFSPGGTFVFATWEHVDNDKAGFRYSNYYFGPQPPPLGSTPPSGTYYPQRSDALPVTRKYPILNGTQAVNEKVHAAIRAVDPKSVWLNYQLIGTQFQPIDIDQPPVSPPGCDLYGDDWGKFKENDPTCIGQPLYLANLVLETNEGLQHFQGLPPTVTAVPPFNQESHYISPGHVPSNPSKSAFKRDGHNVVFSPGGNYFAKQGYNMGGCMGCHGVAQAKGTSFSFVLLNGQAGADVDTQKHFDP